MFVIVISFALGRYAIYRGHIDCADGGHWVSEGTVTAGNEMRVSDAEREAAAAELQEHCASGRLSQDELNERLTATFAAKTRGDLNSVFTDLPSSGHGWAGAGAAGRQALRE